MLMITFLIAIPMLLMKTVKKFAVPSHDFMQNQGCIGARHEEDAVGSTDPERSGAHGAGGPDVDPGSDPLTPPATHGDPAHQHAPCNQVHQ